MMKRLTVLLAIAALGLSLQTQAKVGADEAAKLGKELTPVGAEKAGNKAGTIPEWTPAGQSGPPKDFWPSNPAIDGEKPIFTISKANMAQYAGALTEGHKKLLTSFDTYKMNVYPSHRVASYPDFIYKATLANATTCDLVGVDFPDNCKQGFPYPIPKTGAEPIWNHRLKWRADNARRYNNQLIVQPDGEFQLSKLIEEVTFHYANSQNPVLLTKSSGLFLYYLSHIVSPPRNAGTYILVHEKAGTGTDGRQAWLYTPALKRIRRAPAVCCDNPYEGTDGQQFYDQVDMYNGILERFTWKIVGKKEMYITQNSNRISSNKIKFKDLVKPKHLNQDLPRYEFHRVWIVECNIKPGTSHTFSKRTLYLDEDTWNIVAVDDYDKRGQLSQFQEGHLLFASNLQTSTTIPEVIYHFDSGRYFITAAANEDKPNDASVTYTKDFFTDAYVQKNTTK